mmetsp:Transcript_44921/g.143070  ORF Transcript_44921/g.143070 Transcript_44921/m.143070 type:complete len:478 (-) Transcript_44921:1469-2902(-)
MLVGASGRGDVVLGAGEVRELPRPPAVQGDLGPDDLGTSTDVGVAGHLHGGVGGRPLQREERVVPGLEDGGVDVDVVDDVLRLVPPALGFGPPRVDVRRQDPVVEEVVVVLGGPVGDPNLAQPLDHPRAGASRQQDPEGEAVVGEQVLAIVLEGEQHVALAVQGPADRDRSAVGAVGALRDLSLGARKVNELVLRAHPRDADAREDVAQPNAGPHAVRHGGRAPVEADGLLRHVLLLAAVAGADVRDRDGHEGAQAARRELVHGHLAGLRDAADVEPVRLPGQPRHRTVVAHKGDGGGCDPAGLLQLLQGRLGVEGMAAGEAHHVRVPPNPLVPGAPVRLRHHQRLLLLRHLQLRRPTARGELEAPVDLGAVAARPLPPERSLARRLKERGSVAPLCDLPGKLDREDVRGLRKIHGSRGVHRRPLVRLTQEGSEQRADQDVGRMYFEREQGVGGPQRLVEAPQRDHRSHIAPSADKS